MNPKILVFFVREVVKIWREGETTWVGVVRYYFIWHLLHVRGCIIDTEVRKKRENSFKDPYV